jgi:hypothetical protein
MRGIGRYPVVRSPLAMALIDSSMLGRSSLAPFESPDATRSRHCLNAAS